MCAWGTPAKVRLRCHCSKTMAAGALIGLALIALAIYLFIITHWVVILAVGGFLVLGDVGGTTLVVRRLMRATGRPEWQRAHPSVRVLGPQPVHHHPAPVKASPSPAKPTPARSAPEPTAMDVPDYPPAEWLAQS